MTAREDPPPADLSRSEVESEDGPHDIPAIRNVVLDRLDALVGRWRVAATFPAGFFAPDAPPVTRGGGVTTFEWIDGRHFLLQRFATAADSGAPSGIAVIGLGPDGPFRQQYYDSAVSRASTT
ncbi:DUF1579 domain-containing protein [Nocardia aurantia]|uniref:DUF1579 domain-containing protein n=1 Tax=Nocardia aurantia TaxID=2585199 RepID=A0A7K0DQL8_9NOCA|nr:DUF1579 domain-containing protein [Nocardia aurantia]MQY28049.1 hypothetical protein [Nocardia aurantia]